MSQVYDPGKLSDKLHAEGLKIAYTSFSVEHNWSDSYSYNTST